MFWVPLIISGTGKATAFKLGQYIQRIHPNKIPLKFSEKRERGRIQGLPIFSGTPYYLRNGKSYRFQMWPVHSRGPSEQKPIKIFGEKGAWAYPGTAHFFRYPLLSQEREKLWISNLASTFIGSIGTKAHSKFEKSRHERSQGLPKIFRAPIRRAHRAVIFATAQLSCL